ncbi:hypothetical protein ASD37_14875 [Mycobacterium sp. Root135]|uniref:hypothetical protein n=1 Tax=Mycobacterium sp. Root135 TaxID=1736457 RepID=UPI0006F598B5|nr:hypothetical protein [Mycobacterium sp. Root135]KQY07321.1 hypothetical protein ASD37_14875 [Mycobacterium sp. Root135]
MVDMPRYGVWAAFAVAGALCWAPAAAADPSAFGGRPADTVVADLQAQGYNVSINWVTGYDTKPLSDCRVTGINNPGDIAPTEGTFTTVYVDVACPNGDDGGFRFGAGLG